MVLPKYCFSFFHQFYHQFVHVFAMVLPSLYWHTGYFFSFQSRSFWRFSLAPCQLIVSTLLRCVQESRNSVRNVLRFIYDR